jgi:hypothetical protein
MSILRWLKSMKWNTAAMAGVLPALSIIIACRAPERTLSAEQAASKVEEVVKAEWEKMPKPLPPGADSPGSPDWVGWQYRLSPPFPAAWPPDGEGVVCYYAYSTGFSPARLADAEVLGPVWARVKVDARGRSAPQLQILDRVIKEAGVIGVQPLGKNEVAASMDGDSAAEQIIQASTRTDAKPLATPLIRQYYCAWNRNAGVAEAIRPFHPEFFKWLDCRGI